MFNENMLSSDARTQSHNFNQESTSQKSKPRRISFKILELCQKLQNDLGDTAIRRIGSDLVKSLSTIRQNKFIAARNRIDIPHGLFGLSFDSFNARHSENSLYIDVLQLVNRKTLEEAKLCIVLDDLQRYVSRLFLGYNFGTIEPPLKDIRNSLKLLTISETIENEFKKNSGALKRLQDKLSVFGVHERNAIMSSNNQVYGIQNTCVLTETDPIEFRYKMNFHHNAMEQIKEKSRQVEKNLHKTLDHIVTATNRESTVCENVRMKQGIDIEILKTKIEEMTEQYDRECEHLDGQITNKKNAIEAMHNLYSDCMEKLNFYTTDIVRLREWQAKWEQMKGEVPLVTKQKKKKTLKKK